MVDVLPYKVGIKTFDRMALNSPNTGAVLTNLEPTGSFVRDKYLMDGFHTEIPEGIQVRKLE